MLSTTRAIQVGLGLGILCGVLIGAPLLVFADLLRGDWGSLTAVVFATVACIVGFFVGLAAGEAE